ncbi:MAG: hypothetical protein GY737_27860 [Desulfobacteraceae bacterium]|nr:hypothetical protein [Desulfobacteraceae bacterium]
MKQVMGLICYALLFFALFGCTASTETDPRKGGLFSYNPKAYEQRLEERRGELAETEADTAKTQEETERHKADKQARQAEHESVRQQLSALYADSGKLQRKLDQAKAANAKQEKELARLKTKVAGLRSQTIQVNNFPKSDAAKQKKIEALQKRMNELLAEAEALSGL